MYEYSFGKKSALYADVMLTPITHYGSDRRLLLELYDLCLVILKEIGNGESIRLPNKKLHS